MKRAWCIFFISVLPFFAAAKHFDVFEENGKVGLKNEQGQVVIPAQYEAIGWSNEKVSIVDKVTGYKLLGKWGLINLSNHKVTKAEFDELIPADGSLIIARKKSLSMRSAAGCINTAGKQVIPFQYDGIKIANLRAVVFTRSGTQFNYGVVDLSNKLIIPQRYADIRSLGSLRFAVDNHERKTALFSESGKQLTPFDNDSISPFKKDYAIVYQDQKQGLIDRNGLKKIDAAYQRLAINEDGTVSKRESNEWSFFDGQNQLIRSIRTDSIIPLSTSRFVVSQAGFFRFTDDQLKTVGDGPFNSVGKFENHKAIVTLNGKSGLVRSSGTIIVKPAYTELIVDHSFLIASAGTEGNKKWILLDSVGNVRSSRSYDRIELFNGSFFPVKNKRHWGAIDKNGKEIIACVYDSLLETKNDHVIVAFRGQHGIINLREEWVLPPRDRAYTLVSESRYIERSPKTWFLKSFEGEIIYFSDNSFEVIDQYILEFLASGARWKIDMNGKIAERLIEPEEKTEKVFEEQEGLRAIKRDGKYGFIDSRGRLRIANRYEDVRSFSQGLAPIMIRGKWGFISHQEKIIVQPVYEEVSAFVNGFSFVKQKGQWGVIDITGKQILPPKYTQIEILPGKRFKIYQGKLEGLADGKGNILLIPKYDYVEDLNNGYVIIRRDKNYGLLNVNGVSTIPLIYDSLIYDPYHTQYIAQKRSTWQIIRL